MAKINISDKGKTYKVETESEVLVGAKISDKVKGEDISPELAGYELEITGTSDKSGFPGFKDLKGPGLRKVLVTYGPGMKNRPKKEGKKPTPNNKGLRLRKTFRGNEISGDTVQINIKVLKQGSKKFDDLVKPKEETEKEEPKTKEKPEKEKEEKPVEEKKEKPVKSKEKSTTKNIEQNGDKVGGVDNKSKNNNTSEQSSPNKPGASKEKNQ